MHKKNATPGRPLRLASRIAATAALLLSLPALAQPDLSNRVVIPSPFELPPRPAIPSPWDPPPLSLACGASWAAIGSGAFSVLNPGEDFEVVADPVIVTGPWTGSPFLDLEIAAPDLGTRQWEEFGTALGLQGFRLAIGAPQELTATWECDICNPNLPPGSCCGERFEVAAGGKVHLYLFDGAGFQPERTIPYGSLGDRFGAALALQRFQLLVGSPGAVPGSAHLFEPDTGTYIDSFTSPDATGGDGFASVVALAGDLALVGAHRAHSVYVYRDDGSGSWSAAGTLTSPGSGRFGAAIAADGERIVVGAPGISRAYVFEDDGDSDWPVVAELSLPGSENFGGSVAINGDTVWVSNHRHNGAISDEAGLVAQFDRDAQGAWMQTDTVSAVSPAEGDGFGFLVSASDRMLTALASGDNTQHVFTSADNVSDPDGDGIPSVTPTTGDNCPDDYNPDQADSDGDGTGDACDVPVGC